MKERGVLMDLIDTEVVIEARARGLPACCVCVGALKGDACTRVDLVLDRVEQSWLLAWVERVRARRAAANRRGHEVGVGGKRLGKVVEAVVGVGVDRADRKRLSEEGHS